MDENKENKPKKEFTEAFKRMVVRESLTGELTVKEIARKYNLPHYNTVTIWRTSLRNKLDDVIDLRVKPESPQEKQELEVVKKRAKELEKALSHANLKIAALETMIDIAESDLNIKIRKKSGTKQSE